MQHPETVEVHSAGRVVIINKSDFDPKKHKLVNEVKEAKEVKAKPEVKAPKEEPKVEVKEEVKEEAKEEVEEEAPVVSSPWNK